jgi:hypothetical protein
VVAHGAEIGPSAHAINACRLHVRIPASQKSRAPGSDN